MEAVNKWRARCGFCLSFVFVRLPFNDNLYCNTFNIQNAKVCKKRREFPSKPEPGRFFHQDSESEARCHNKCNDENTLRVTDRRLIRACISCFKICKLMVVLTPERLNCKGNISFYMWNGFPGMIWVLCIASHQK